MKKIIKICPNDTNHNAFIKYDDNFCPACGIALQEKAEVCECGKALYNSFNFCPKCGKSAREA